MPLKTISRILRAALLSVAGLAASMSAGAQGVDEDTLRAAFVVNFLRYTEWPVQSTAPGQPLVVLVVGADRSSALVRKMAEAAGGHSGRPIEVRRARLPSSPQKAREVLLRRMDEVHAVFVAQPDPEIAEAVIEIARDRPVLTIGVGEEFVRAGGMLALLREGSHIAFASNVHAIISSPINVSSKVLKISRPLHRELRGPDGAHRGRVEPQIAAISRPPGAASRVPAVAVRGC